MAQPTKVLSHVFIPSKHFVARSRVILQYKNLNVMASAYEPFAFTWKSRSVFMYTSE